MNSSGDGPPDISAKPYNGGTLDGAAELIDRIDREYAAIEDTLAAPRSTPAS